MVGSNAFTTVPMRTNSSGDSEYLPPALPQFEIGARLGGGGMGVVFEACHVVLQRRVALKFTHPETARSDKAHRRLLREAKALARLNHPNIVTLFEVGTVGDEMFIAMELVGGGTLRDWMKTPHDWREIIDMFFAFGCGLAAAHELGLVHRDINPSNVFLDHDGTPKIGDFGLVRVDGDDDLEPDLACAILSRVDVTMTTTGRVLGTPAYMAPEQLRAGRVDARADQYAYCASLHEALTGQLPRGRDLRDVPRRLRPILARGLSELPDDRFPSMTALLGAIARTRGGPTRRWLARHIMRAASSVQNG